MPAEVLYRKWRPQRFSEVAGQEAITRTLRNAVSAGKVSHAYLFSGPRGTGKTSIARILARAVNCANPDDGEPCDACPSCLAFAEGRALDLIEMDAASNRGIDEVKEIRQKVSYAPAIGPHKVYLIDEVHMLTEPAFNALLKTLEEPPEHVIFILATTELQKVPATILSRCQRFDFRRIPVPALAARLEEIARAEGIACPRDGLEEVARLAAGSARDAINLLEQLVDYRGRNLTMDDVRAVLDLSGDERAIQLASHALHGKLAEGLETIANVRDDGVDLKRFQRDVVTALRELLVLQSGAESRGRWSASELEQLKEVIQDIETPVIVRALRAFGQADLRADPLSPLPLELALAETVLAPAHEPEASVSPPAVARPVATPPAQRRPQAAASQPRQPAPRRAQAPAGTSPQPPAARADAAPQPAIEGNSRPPEPTEPSDEAPPATAREVSLVDRIRYAIDTVDRRQAAWLNGTCHVGSCENGVLTLVFYNGFGIHKGKVESSPLREMVERAASDILGEPVKVRCIMGERPKKGGHTVERLVQQHGARIVSRE